MIEVLGVMTEVLTGIDRIKTRDYSKAEESLAQAVIDLTLLFGRDTDESTQRFLSDKIELMRVKVKPQIVPITAGGLLKEVRGFEGGLTVKFDHTSELPTRFMSYRGHYNHMSLDYSPLAAGMDVKRFVESLKYLMWSELDGYKGGRFKMSPAALMYAARYGEANGTAIIGAYVKDRSCILRTAHSEII